MDFDNSRTVNLIGSEAASRLKRAHVAIFGIGGVGGYICEALCRAGVGELTLIDGDTVAPSNLNRQLAATLDTVGMPKTHAVRDRLVRINPACEIHCKNLFFLPENADLIDFSSFDYVADAVDTVAAKIEIICRAQSCGTPVISSMGAGNKLYPERFRISDIYETSVCPLSRVMRRELKARGVKSLPVVWSDEMPVKQVNAAAAPHGKIPPASISFVPSAAGLIAAGKIVRDIAGIK